MRWMSNLFRLAYLDEADRHSVAHDRDPRHQAEIRRLRRMSMAPAAGRYYPVDDSDPDDFLSPEDARQLVELWRSRQTARALEDDPDFDVVFSEISPLAPIPSPFNSASEEDWDDDDPDDEQLRALSDQQGATQAADRTGREEAEAVVVDRLRPRAVVSYPYDKEQHDFADFDENEVDDADEWSEYRHLFGSRNGRRSRAAPPLIPSSHHPLTNDPDEPEPLPNRALQFATFVFVMLITALLGLAAASFVHGYLRSPPPQPAEEVMLDTTKIVPPHPIPELSPAVLKAPAGVRGRNTKHETRNAEHKARNTKLLAPTSRAAYTRPVRPIV